MSTTPLTRPCPFCGYAVPEQGRFCGQCGRTIEPGSSSGALGSKKTLLESSPNAPVAPAAPSSSGHASAVVQKSPAKTMMLGGGDAPRSERAPQARESVQPAPIVAAGSAAPEAAPKHVPNAHRTMLGMPARELPGAAPLQAEAQPQPAPAFAPAHKTMLGVARPGIAPTHEPTPKPQGTLLGVAIPGIAPTHGTASGSAGALPASTGGTSVGFPASPAPLPPIVPAPAPLVEEPLPAAPQLPKKSGVPAIAVVGIVFLIVAVAGGAAAFFVLRGGAALTAQPQLDDTGRESLKIRCDTCADGTVVSLGASSAKVAGGAAVLPLPAPLSIGDNDLAVKIDRPGSGRDEEVKVHVPVAYRVRADVATLSAKPPALTVRIEATPGSEVTVEGKPIALDSTGRGAYAIDLSKDVEGTSDEQKTVERKIAFTIAPKGGTPENGQLTARAAIVPLHLDAPGYALYTDRGTAAIAGQTKVGGTLTIDGQAAPVDAQGRFGVRVALDAAGEKNLEIMASAPPLAPRIVHVKVARVASLEATAKELEGKSPLPYDAFAADPAAKRGSDVVVEGEVVEARAQQGYTVLVVDAKKGCTAGKGACLVRVVHGEELKVARGDSVRAFGRLDGTVAASGKTVPDVEGALVVAKAGRP